MQSLLLTLSWSPPPILLLRGDLGLRPPDAAAFMNLKRKGFFSVHYIYGLDVIILVLQSRRELLPAPGGEGLLSTGRGARGRCGGRRRLGEGCLLLLGGRHAGRGRGHVDGRRKAHGGRGQAVHRAAHRASGQLVRGRFQRLSLKVVYQVVLCYMVLYLRLMPLILSARATAGGARISWAS